MTDPDDPTILRTREDQAPAIEGFADLVEIGRGGFSVVYAATELAFQRRVAIKVLQGGADETRRLHRESLALGALSGIPHVITPYSIVRTTDGRPALVLPLFPRSLASTLRGGSRPAVDDVLRWGTQIATALDAAHARSIHHRDIKPENVLISDAGDAYLADFGIAAVDGLDAATVTVASLSPQHAPPERFLDQDVDPAAGDRYSLASTTYTALSGHAPFGSAAKGGVLGLMNRVANDAVPPLGGELGRADEVFAQALAKMPANRHSLAVEFMTALSSHFEASATPTGRPTFKSATLIDDQRGPDATRSNDPGDFELGIPGGTTPLMDAEAERRWEYPTILRDSCSPTGPAPIAMDRQTVVVYEVPPWHAHHVAASLHASGIPFSWAPNGDLVTNSVNQVGVERVLSALPPLEYPSALSALLAELQPAAHRLAAGSAMSRDILRVAELSGMLPHAAIPSGLSARSWSAVVEAASHLTTGLESKGPDRWTDESVAIAASVLRDLIESVIPPRLY